MWKKYDKRSKVFTLKILTKTKVRIFSYGWIEFSLGFIHDRFIWSSLTLKDFLRSTLSEYSFPVGMERFINGSDWNLDDIIKKKCAVLLFNPHHLFYIYKLLVDNVPYHRVKDRIRLRSVKTPFRTLWNFLSNWRLHPSRPFSCR